VTTIAEDLARYRDDTLYFDAHRDEFVATYPDQWVAIYNKQLVAAAHDLPELLQKLHDRGIPRGRAFKEFVATEDVDLILMAR